LRSLYSAYGGLLDPLRAREVSYNLVVRSVQARIGLIKTGHPDLSANSASTSKGKSPMKATAGQHWYNLEIFSVRASMLVRLTADILLSRRLKRPIFSHQYCLML
jgi:hypothetical protein